MAIFCPHCKGSIQIKGAKPGRYTPKCPKCAQRMVVVVPADPKQEPSVTPLAAGAALEPSLPGQPPPSKPAAAKAAAASAVNPNDLTAPEITAPPAPARVAGVAARVVNPDVTAPEAPAPNIPANFTGQWTPPPAVDPDVTAAELPQPARDPDTTAAELPQPAALEDRTDAWGGSSPASAPAADRTDPHYAAKTEADLDAREKIPETLGGYRVVKELGRGGMGTVYLARQMSLDRPVALKVMDPTYAKDATFLARFTREAYAAAQLVHHNVVQIYDIGAQADLNYFSMEFVEGQSLGQLVKEEGRLAAVVAAGYMLQAARGLQFAHDRGMIHRDIKPDNLMINTQGIVKVADLGLVKLRKLPDIPASAPGAPASGKAPDSLAAASAVNVTQAHVAMGTPSYMAPEQANDAANVDARADIYSLGCTLYNLLTGQPLFKGSSTLEVMTKHASEPVVPPEMIVKDVPKTVSVIVQKMVAKKPSDRYPAISGVIAALEEFLQVNVGGDFKVSEEQVATLEKCARVFSAAPGERVRQWVFAGLALVAAVLLLFFTVKWYPLMAVRLLLLTGLTPLAYIVISGSSEKSYLYLKLREFVLENSLTDWLTVAAGLILALVILFFCGLFVSAVIMAVLAVLIAYGLYQGFDRPLLAQRRAPIAKAEQLLKTLRLRGVEEEQLRQLVCEYGGERWEAFFETLFGYEAKLEARTRWGRDRQNRPRAKAGAWREPVVRWIDAHQQTRREAREKKLLLAIQQKELQAQGLSAADARDQAEGMADALVGHAAAFKRSSRRRGAGEPAPQAALQLDFHSFAKPKPKTLGQRIGSVLHVALGPQLRFLAGAALVAGCVWWMNQNEMIKWEQVQSAVAKTSNIQDEKNMATMEDVKKTIEIKETTNPLNIPAVPGWLTNGFNSFNPGIAGLLLLFAALFPGTLVGVSAFVGALVICAGGRFGIPPYELWHTDLPSAFAGLGLAIGGFMLDSRQGKD